jgi:hypothetical protein
MTARHSSPDAFARAEATAALQRLAPRKKPHSHALGVSAAFGPWSVSCGGREDWRVSIRLRTVDEMQTYPTIAEVPVRGQPTADAWADAIHRALVLAAHRIDTAARALPPADGVP